MIPTWAQLYYEVIVFFLLGALTVGVLGQGVLFGPRSKATRRAEQHPRSQAVFWMILLAIGAGLLVYELM